HRPLAQVPASSAAATALSPRSKLDFLVGAGGGVGTCLMVGGCVTLRAGAPHTPEEQREVPQLVTRAPLTVPQTPVPHEDPPPRRPPRWRKIPASAVDTA